VAGATLGTDGKDTEGDGSGRLCDGAALGMFGGMMADLPHAVWSGEFTVWGVVLHCSVLSTGQRVIDARDVEALFRQGIGGDDDGDLAALVRWQRGDG
jgi:hypothetical protein